MCKHTKDNSVDEIVYLQYTVLGVDGKIGGALTIVAGRPIGFGLNLLHSYSVHITVYARTHCLVYATHI